MIARLRGELLEQDGDRIVIDAGGVGYEVLTPQSVYVQLPDKGEKIDLWIRQIVREDGWTLYGFNSPVQRRLFDLLREVKGCGPKVSLALIGELGEEAVISAITSQDVKELIKTTGVGLRTAERIIVELKDKLQQELLLQNAAYREFRSHATNTPKSEPLVEALLALGYRRSEVEEVALELYHSEISLEDQLRTALTRLHQRGKRS